LAFGRVNDSRGGTWQYCVSEEGTCWLSWAAVGNIDSYGR